MLGSAPFRCALLHLTPLTLACLCTGQSTWYVDDDAAPPGNGTLASPYANIRYGIDQPTTLDGDLILVLPGTYPQVGQVKKSITVRSTAGPLETTVLVTAGAGFGLNFGDVVPTVEGFSIVASPGAIGTYGVILDNGHVKRCILRGHRYNSVFAGGYGVEAVGLFVGSLTQCTLVDNEIGAEGPPIGIFPVKSCILYGNLEKDAVAIDGSYSIWGTGLPSSSQGNLVGDPLLWDLHTPDVHLTALSPAIDSGHPSLPPDPDGSPADRGAVPFDASYLPPIAVYCTGKVNSQGCAASIGASGGAGASMTSPSPFLVTCSNVVEGVPGLMFWGHAPRAVPFMGGYHCVQPPTPRCAAQLAGSSGSPCSGAFSFDFNAYAQSGANPTLAAGQVIRAQYWYRDPSDPAGFGAATSNAIQFPLGL